MKGVNQLDIHKYCKYCKYCKYQKILKYIEIYCKILRYINDPKIDNFQPVTYDLQLLRFWTLNCVIPHFHIADDYYYKKAEWTILKLHSLFLYRQWLQMSLQKNTIYVSSQKFWLSSVQ